MALIHGLHFNNLRGDLLGGLTAAVVALPLALAFGMQPSGQEEPSMGCTALSPPGSSPHCSEAHQPR